jgi:salicylate hydroxylase
MENSNSDTRIAIVGAGMGGLTAALALAKRGFTNIDVYESASNLGFVGAGIQLAPNMGRSELYHYITYLASWPCAD